MIAVALAIAAAIAIGVAAEHRYGERAQAASAVSLRAMLNVIVPVVAFFNIARLEVDVDVGGGIVLAFLAILISGVLAWIVADRVLGLPRPGQGAVIVCAIQANTGYLGLPLTVALLGQDHLPEAVAYDTLVQAVGTVFVAFAIGAAFGGDAGDTRRERVLGFVRNPPLIAVALALLAPDALAPDALVDASRVLVIALLPLGFFAVGVTLATEQEEGALRFPPPLTAPVVAAVAFRISVAPALLLALSAPLIDLPASYLLLAAMPCGINGLIVAHATGLDLRITAGAIAWSTVIVVLGALGVSLFE